MRFFKEFKEFAIKGNVFDMAVGIIIGSAFTKVVNSIVTDLIMPVLSIFVGKISFKELLYTVQEAQLDAEGKVIAAPIEIRYGYFLQNMIDFIIIAMCIYLVVRMFNKLRKKSENEKDGSVTTPKNIELLAEIRDLLKDKK